MGALEKLRETSQKIREAVYGIEVRDSIADGFENVVDAQNEYEMATTVKFETKLNDDFGRFSEELTAGVGEYVNTRVEERIVEVMDDLSDDNLRSEIQQARNSAAYAVNYVSVDARLEADEVKLKDVMSEVNAARNSTANGKTYTNLDARLEEIEATSYTKDEVDNKFLLKSENGNDVLYTGSAAPASNGYVEVKLAKNAKLYRYLLVTVMVWVDWTTEKFYHTGIVYRNDTFSGGHFQEINTIASVRLISNDDMLRAYRWNGARAYQIVRIVGVK